MTDKAEQPNERDWGDIISGVLLGTAVGDALGLPREMMSRRRARRMFGGSPLKHRFFFGRGMMSDDTEHACMVGQALLSHPENAEEFASCLAWKLRWWIIGLPAGVGKATALAGIRLWLGFGPSRSGVKSAGNGPAMRSALLGVLLGHDPIRLREFVRGSTRLTHTDPRAERGALLIARAAYCGASEGPDRLSGIGFLDEVMAEIGNCDDELKALLTKMKECLGRQAKPEELADALNLGMGVSGYIYHTVAMALYCWLRWPGDFRMAVEGVILLGGDTDTTGAISGALVGATVGARAIPREWVGNLCEWPRSRRWLEALACRLASLQSDGQVKLQVPFFWPGLLVRNLFFLAVVLMHGFRRLFPPY